LTYVQLLGYLRLRMYVDYTNLIVLNMLTFNDLTLYASEGSKVSLGSIG